MTHNPVFVFGAGATAACGGPTTDELLPAAFRVLASTDPASFHDPWEGKLMERISELARFLRETFHVDIDDQGKVGEGATFPSVPLLLSVVHTAIDRAQPIGSWAPERLASLRTALQAACLVAIFSADQPSRKANPYARLLAPFYTEAEAPVPVAITLNYDSLLDQAMLSLGSKQGLRVPDYGCDLTIPSAPEVARFGRLLKLHGSLNWLYCRRCARLSLHMAGLNPEKSFWAIFEEMFAGFEVFVSFVENVACARCQGPLSPLIVTPSVLKDYRNPHLSRVWYEAEQELRKADRVLFVGYSLPWDDVEVIYMLKQSLDHLSPDRITVVEYSKAPVSIQEHEAGKRYASLFGKRIGWSSLGFEGWLDDCERRQVSPLEGRECE